MGGVRGQAIDRSIDTQELIRTLAPKHEGAADAVWNLRRLRVARGITQEGLAVDAGVDRTYVSGIERREFNPSVDLLDRLAAALTVDILDLLAIPGDDQTAPSPPPAGRKRRSTAVR